MIALALVVFVASAGDTTEQEYVERLAPAQSAKSLGRHPFGRYNVVDITQGEEKFDQFSRPDAFSSEPSAQTPKVFGLGLSRTGTSSLARGLKILGLNVIHFDHDLTSFMPRSEPFDWSGMYDDVDGAVDLPTAFYYAELLQQYPQAKFILTTREADSWFDSFQRYLETITKHMFAPATAPITMRLLHSHVYGSPLPNASLWKANYVKHYNRVRQIIPKQQLLEISTQELSDALPLLCTFLGISPCPNVQVPRLYSTQSLNKLSSHIPQHRWALQVSPPTKNQYAYATLLAYAGTNEFKAQFLQSALVWCQSIRDSHVGSAADGFDIVLMILHVDLNPEMKNWLGKCFDRVVPIHKFGFSPRGMNDTEYFSAIRAKFWVFGLTDYKRVIFMDSDTLVVRPIDYLFFKDYYEGRQTVTPAAVYALPSKHSPISTSIFSLETNVQTVVDLQTLYLKGQFNYRSGWLEYGLFTFSMEATGFPESWQGGSDALMPYAPLFPQPDAATGWVDSKWNFYCSWSDQGMLFYYYYLLLQNGGILRPADIDHAVIHYIGVNKPWLDSKVPHWAAAIDLWRNTAKKMGLLHAKFSFNQSAIKHFHSEVSRFKGSQRILLDPYESTTSDDVGAEVAVALYAANTPSADVISATTSQVGNDPELVGNSADYPAASDPENYPLTYQQAGDLPVQDWARGQLKDAAMDLGQDIIEHEVGVPLTPEGWVEEAAWDATATVAGVTLGPEAAVAVEAIHKLSDEYEVGQHIGVFAVAATQYVQTGAFSADVTTLKNNAVSNWNSAVSTVSSYIKGSTSPNPQAIGFHVLANTDNSYIRNTTVWIKPLRSLVSYLNMTRHIPRKNITHPSLCGNFSNQAMWIGIAINGKLYQSYVMGLGYIRNGTHPCPANLPAPPRLANLTWRVTQTRFAVAVSQPSKWSLPSILKTLHLTALQLWIVCGAIGLGLLCICGITYRCVKNKAELGVSL